METKLPQIHVGDLAEIQLMAGGPALHGTVQGISRAIANPTAARGGLLASVDPNFEWIRLAQRIPVRIAIDQGQNKLPLDGAQFEAFRAGLQQVSLLPALPR